jgi:hypothetical protein
MIDNDYKEYVMEAAQAVGCRLTEMSPLESVFFRKTLLQKFTESYEHYALWENLSRPFAIRQSHSWEWIDEFLQGSEFLFLFDADNDETIYIISENQSLSKLLSEMPIKVFYITNEKLDFILSYNDHEYLIAAGTAETWLHNKAKELSKSGWIDMDGKSY